MTLPYTEPPSPLGRTIKLPEGITVEVFDVGVDDLDKAALNRKRIKNKFATSWWREMENARDSANSKWDMPSWVPRSYGI